REVQAGEHRRRDVAGRQSAPRRTRLPWRGARLLALRRAGEEPGCGAVRRIGGRRVEPQVPRAAVRLQVRRSILGREEPRTLGGGREWPGVAAAVRARGPELGFWDRRGTEAGTIPLSVVR